MSKKLFNLQLKRGYNILDSSLSINNLEKAGEERELKFSLERKYKKESMFKSVIRGNIGNRGSSRGNNNKSYDDVGNSSYVNTKSEGN